MVNDLIGVVADPNVFIQESKVATCDIRPGRRPRGPALLEYVAGYRQPGRDHAGNRDTHDLDTGRAAHTAVATTPEETAMTHDNSFYGPLADPAADAGYAEHPPRVGFFTDTSVCIGCKACEVACKEWNAVPDDGFDLLGHVVRQHRRARRRLVAARRFIEQPARGAPVSISGMPGRRSRPPAMRCGCPETPHGLPLADVLRRVQALHARRLPGRLPDRRAVPHRVRHGGRAAGHLQRLRLLRLGLPVRGDRAARGRRPGLEVHAVLRPAARRPGAGLREGVPDRLDPVRPAGRAAGARGASGWSSCTSAGVTEARLYGHDPNDGVGGDGAFFLLLDEPEVYGLPPDPVVPTRDLASMWRYAGLAASALVGRRGVGRSWGGR